MSKDQILGITMNLFGLYRLSRVSAMLFDCEIRVQEVPVGVLVM